VPLIEPSAQRSGILRQPGFGWGVAAGLVIMVVLLAALALVTGLVFAGVFSSEFSGPVTNVTLSPVDAGEPWFEISDDGTGVLEGWSYGSYGSDYESGPTYMFQVYEVGSVDGLPVEHVLSMGADDDTQFFIGTQPYDPDVEGQGSTASKIFDDMESSGNVILDGEMKLVIEFRREGDTLVATKVTADPSSQPAPMLEW